MIAQHTLSTSAATKLRRSGFAAVVVVAVVLGSAPWGRAGEEDAPPKTSPVSAKLTDLAWIQGHWTTKFGPNELHEIWSPPNADCMMASFCWIKNGSIWMYELLTMREDDDTIVLRFKHFSRDLHGWEEKDEALTLVLVELSESLAAFKNTGDGGPTWMVFRRESPTQLTVRVGSKREGGEDGFELKYDRVK